MFYILRGVTVKLKLPTSAPPDIAGSKVQFDARGDGLARYTIFNFQRFENGQHRYKVSPVLGHGDGTVEGPHNSGLVC